MSWIQNIANGIESAFSMARPPLPFIPPLLLLCEVNNRPGLSAIALTAAIIKRLGEAGIVSGVNPDGSPNKICMFIRIFVEEMVKEFKDNASISSMLVPGAVNSVGTGANAGGPVVVTSMNTIPMVIKGILH